MSAPLLETVDLTRRFPGRRRGWLQRRGSPLVAVDGVSFAVPRGGCFGLVGESGSGKTTIARLLVGLLAPDRGEVRLDGSPVRLEGRSARCALYRRLQYVHQHARLALNPRRHVGYVLAAPLRTLLGVPRRERRSRVREALERVGLGGDAARRYPHAFSGGQAQRIAIARALIVKPDLLVLDEPTSALDVRVQAQLLDLLKELRRELGTAMLLISHDLALVGSFCDEVAILREGRIIEWGPSRQVFGRPQEAYTRELVRSVPVPGCRPGFPLGGGDT